MQEVPDDMFQYDTQTLPQEDPKVAEAIAKGMEKDAKLRAAIEKKEKAEVKKLEATMNADKRKRTEKPVVDSADPTTRKREIKLHKIRLYFDKLGHKISVPKPKTLPKTDEAIDELLASIEAQLHSDGGIEKAGVGYLSVCGMIEQGTKVFNPLGWDLEGPKVSFAATVAANKKQWEELVTEFAIANAEWFMVSFGVYLPCLAQLGANKQHCFRSLVSREHCERYWRSNRSSASERTTVPFQVFRVLTFFPKKNRLDRASALLRLRCK